MAKGRKTGGRTAGTPNKTSAEAKEAIAQAFVGIGGQKAFEAWAKSNPDVYYASVFPKLLPVQVNHGAGEGKGRITIEWQTDTSE